jgi:hypothetical protein
MTDNKDQDSTYDELNQQRLLKLQQCIRLYLERKKYAPMYEKTQVNQTRP